MLTLYKVLKNIGNHPLNKNNKIIAWFRFVKWNLLLRIMPYSIVYKWISESRLVIKRGMSGATGSLYSGLFEFNDMSFLLHLLKEEDLFVDIGANVGVYTVLASKVRRAKSVAIEPVPSTYSHLMDNIRINDLGNLVKVLNLGVGAERKILKFTNTEDAKNHVLEETSIEIGIEVKVDILDSILDTKIPLLIKIDVEGFETEVIKGGTNVFTSSGTKAVIIELNGLGRRYGFDENWIHNQLLEWGYLPYEYQPLTRKLKVLDTFNNENTIYIKDLVFVKKRITESLPFTVFGNSI